MRRAIVAVEDNPQHRYMMQFLLGHHGYEVVPAPDVRRALSISMQLRPVCILLDIQLPGVDGYTIARALRSASPLLNTPIIAVTAHAMRGDREMALDAGCSGYIEKPIDPYTFVAQLEAILANHTRRGVR